MSRINSAQPASGPNGPNPIDPNEVIAVYGTQTLSPSMTVTITVFSKVPVQVISGTIGDQKIVF